jgi:basic membrane lipoprotein Med (substrate-binding protein (PBP1-ABC) superfamily)/DNA-binding SARP family transcriptional activator
VEYRILGSLEVSRAGESVEVGPRRLRMLLALLAINANRVVTTDRILEELWGEDADGKENALWVYISRLRSALGDENAVVTRDHGYSLIVGEDHLDSRRFEAAIAEGRAVLRQDPERAASLLAEGLGLWRGPALEEFEYDDFAQSEIRRLTELRLSALEDRLEADLQRGLAGQLVSELEVLRRSHPTRERIVHQLMLALYRAGRQSEALRAFESYRVQLAEELGLDPSPELQRLEEQILLHDSRIQGRHPDRAHSPLARSGAANPFKGLRAFHEDDSSSFFGRDRLVADIVRRLDSGISLIGLVGPSGSGKSSVARAGVIPALRKGAMEGSDRWVFAHMVPGAHPFAELEAALLRASLEAPDSLSEQLADPETGILRAVLRVLPEEQARLVLVIDQFEELFTLVDDEARRADFLRGLLTATQDPHGRVRVIFTLRADFYDRPLRHPEFGTAMSDGIVNVVPMSPDELEVAARRPSEEAGVTLEPSLLASLLADVLGRPGGLPLFQYALTELFDRRSDQTLTLAGYESMGGVAGALGRRAEAIHADLGPVEQAAARQLFLRLVTIADGGEWGRRRVPASEILSLDIDVIDLQTVIDAFVAHRLLTLDRHAATGAPTVELAHEALLTNWSRLESWIDDARDDLRRHDALTAALTEWDDAGGDPGYLLTGARLASYDQWASETTMRLTEVERDFLDLSRAQHQRIEDERTDRVTEAARSARRRGAAIAGVIGLVAVLALGFFGVIGGDGPTVAFFGSPEDKGWNANIVAGLDRAAREFDLVLGNVRPTVDPAAELRALAESGADLIVTDSAPTLYATDVFTDFPDVSFAVIDGFVDSPNTSSILFANEHGGYLAGAAAAMKSETGIVGFVGGLRLESIEEFRAGFEAGARSIDPQIEVLATYVEERPDGGIGSDAFARPDLGDDRATKLYDLGADVVFGAAGFSSFGVFDAAVRESDEQGRHLWAIGVDNDQWFSVDVDERRHLLTSIVKRGDVAAFLVTEQFIDGSLTAGVQEIDLSDEAFDFSTEGDGLTDGMISWLESIKADVAAGRIQVPTAPTGVLLVEERGDLAAFTPFGTGTYTMTELGTPVTFTVEGSWWTRPVDKGLFVISTPESNEPGDHDIVVARPTNLIDPATGEPNIDASDLQRWLDLAPDTVSISDPTFTTLDGMDAIVFDVVVSDEAVGFVVVGPIEGYYKKGFLYQVHWIDHPDGPIMIASGTTGSDPSWHGTTRQVIETIEFG